MEAVKSIISSCGIVHNVEEAGIIEESCTLGWLGIFVIVVVVGFCVISRSSICSVVAASGDVALRFVVWISGIGLSVGTGGVIVIIVVVDGCSCSCCSCSCICCRDWMLWMSWRLIASRSTGVCGFVVVAVGVVERLQREVVLGAGVGVGVRGSVIIVVCWDQSVVRIRLIHRCRKGNFSTSAAMVH